MYDKQSQSHLEQIIIAAISKIIPAKTITGLTLRDNHVLISLDQTDPEQATPLLQEAIGVIDPSLKLQIFASGPRIRYTIAVASGKGGVGKSTIAVNLAFAFAQLGLKTALLDADIYGPSVPHMLGLEEQPHSEDGKLMKPLLCEGVKCMSMGLLIPKDQPAVWRGPMVIKALKQMLFQVDWGSLDILVIDMPPGTGDAQLTLAQSAQLNGVIMVSTPQDLALIDARKGWKMFQTMDIPILGLIENMSSFTCPHCEQNSSIFNHGGAHKAATKENIHFLGEIPLNISLRESGDSHMPYVLNHKDATSDKFTEIASDIWSQLNAAGNHGANAAAPQALSA